MADEDDDSSGESNGAKEFSSGNRWIDGAGSDDDCAEYGAGAGAESGSGCG
jgi:hypothetical protein